MYFAEELPKTYGKLQGFCTEYFLGLMIKKAHDVGLIREARIYMDLRAAFRRSQRGNGPWHIRVNQFNEDLTAAINTSTLLGREAQLIVDQRQLVEKYGYYEIGTSVHNGPGPIIMGPEREADGWPQTQDSVVGPDKEKP